MKKRSKNIFLFVESSHGFGRDVLRGVAQYAARKPDWVVQFEGRGLYEANLEALESRQWDGMIVRSFNEQTYQRLTAKKIPMVELFHQACLGKPEVSNDEALTGKAVVSHFYELGLRRFAFYSFGSSWWLKERSRCFAEAVQQRGLPLSVFAEAPHLAPVTSPILSPSREAMVLTGWLQHLEKPVGLFAGTDPMALRVINACREANIRIPEDIAVCGSDNDSLFCALASPSLTSVDLSGQRVGWEAMRLLDIKMTCGKLPVLPILIPPLEVVARDSTDFIPADDPDAALAIRYIRANATQGIRVIDVLKRYDLSSRTLQRMIQRHLGRTPEQEILRVRFLKAKQLLEETFLSLEQIALQSGFASSEYFVKAFKKQFGKTPLQYRKEELDKKNSL